MIGTHQPATLLHPLTGRERVFLQPNRRREQAAPPPLRAEAPANVLSRILRPEAASRWALPALAQMTPQYIDTILRNAMAGSHIAQWELFDLMEDTWPRLAKNCNELKRAVQSLQWTCRPWAEDQEAPLPEAEERAKLVSHALWKMRPDPATHDNGFSGTIYDILDAWFKGISVLEVLWEKRAAGKLGTIIAPQATAWVHPSHYGWDRDSRIGLSERSGIVEFPPHKFLVSACRARTTHPLAGALLRPLAWWWCAANFSGDWLLNLAQVFGLPFRWANYDPQASDATVTRICTMLENMGSAGWAAFPSGTTLDLKETTKAGSLTPQGDILDRADKQCDLLVFHQTLTSEAAPEGGGSYALGKVHEGGKEGVILDAGNFVASILNEQITRSILRLNYGDEELAPEWLCEIRKQEDLKANAERDAILINAGMALPRPWLYERHGIPLPQEGEDVVERTAAPSLFGPMPTPGDDAAEARQYHCRDSIYARAQGTATEQVIEHALENLTGVQARWLGALKPFFRELMAKAADGTVSDADFIRALEQARRQMPELFTRLNHDALADALEAAMGAGAVNGILRGYMQRRPRRGA